MSCPRGLAALLWCALLLALPVPASAEAPEFLFQVPEENSLPGSGAGQLDNPRGIATDSTTGHIFVADGNNARISEFTSWGEFVKAWGWGVADGTTNALQTCTSPCFKGITGSGGGQFGFPQGVAIDSAGDVYVVDEGNQRVQKFSPEGEFLLMFGGGVNQTTGEDVCTKADLEAGEICGAGSTGDGQGEFTTLLGGTYIALGPGGIVHVGDEGRVQKFDSGGSFLSEVAFGGEFASAVVRALTVDSAGNLYVAFHGLPNVRKLDPTGAVLDTLDAEGPLSVAVDSESSLYVVNLQGDPGFGTYEVLKYDSAGICEICPGDEFATPPLLEGTFQTVKLNGIAPNLLGDGTNSPGDVYVSAFFSDTKSYFSAYGPLPKFEPPPEREPLIQAQAGGPVGTTTASVSAEINPRFYASTTYYVEYGTAPCKEGGCTSVPAPPGQPLGAERNAFVRTAPIELQGLTPGTEYFIRFIATSGSFTTKGEGPLQLEGSFTTFGGQLGPGELPDDRAYELVSPADKENGEAGSPEPSSGLVTTTVAPQQASLDGEGLTYTSFTAFGTDPKSAPAASQYLSKRTAGGWATNNITPISRESFLADPLRGFSEDLRYGAVVQIEPSLLPGAPEGFENLYVQENDAETLELVTGVEPQITVPKPTYCVGFAAATEDFSHVLLTARGSLGDGATAAAGQNLYEWVRGEGLRLVSRLPGSDNPAAPTFSTAFGPTVSDIECKTGATIQRNVISDDGSKVFWTRGTATTQLMARVDGTSTVQLDKTQGGPGPAGGGVFQAASEDGNYVFFTAPGKLTPGAGPIEGTEFGDLYRYDFTKPEGSRLANIAKGGDVLGVLGASEDGSRVYFAAKGALDAGEGPTGEVAEAGQPNLYLWSEGEGVRFIAVLSKVQPGDFSNWSTAPNGQSARTTPDGSALAFLSRNPLTGYDNRGLAENGAPVSELFLYDATEDELRCASCNPTGARPLGGTSVPGWWSATTQPRYLSDSGNRAFFESEDALDPRDTNGKTDVYEFELAGEGDCTAQSLTYVADSGGCLALLSSGTHHSRALLVDASPSGADVFLATPEQLTWEDTDDRYDIYDARVGGGFPEPPPPPPGCEGEGCRGSAPPVPPAPGPPASSTLTGSGNVKERPRCPKGKRQVKRGGKVRCVPKGGGKGSRRANPGRRGR